MDHARARAWVRGVCALRGGPASHEGSFAALWMDRGMNAAVTCFLALRRYARTNQPSDLCLAQHLATAHLANSAPGATFFDDVLHLLHRALWRAYGASGWSELDYLKRTLDLGRRALEGRELGDDDYRISFVVEHVLALRTWADQRSDPDTLSQAVLLWCRALAHGQWEATRTLEICWYFTRRFVEILGNSVDTALVADHIIDFDRRILAGSAHVPNRQLSAAHDLAYWLNWRFDRTGALDDLEEQISVRRQILQLCPIQDSTRARCCDNLGVAFRLLNLHAPGSSRFIDEFVAVARESLQLRPPGDPARNASCSNLANALSLRVQQTGDHSFFEEIIALQKESLLLGGLEGSNRAASCVNLAHFLMELYMDTKAGNLLEEAEKMLEEAIRLTPAEHTTHVLACIHLAAMFQHRYAAVGDQRYLNRAVELLDKALAVPGHPDSRRADILIELGDALWEQMRLSAECTAVGERTMVVRHEVLALTSPDHPLHIQALLGLVRLRIDQSTAFFDPPKAIEHLQKAASVPTAYGRSLLRQLSVLLADPGIPALPASVMPPLLEVYDTLLTWLALPNYTVNLRDRLRSLGSTHSLGSYVLACAIKAANVKAGVELLEHSRALLWRHALNMRDPELESLPEAKRREIEDVRHAFSLSMPAEAREADAYLTSRDILHRKAERLQDLIAEVRLLPGHERFMRGMPYADLAATTASGPVVVLSAAPNDGNCHAIIIPSPAAAPFHVPIPGLTPDDLKRLSLDCVDSARNAAKNGGHASLRIMGTSRRSPSSKAHKHLAVLWRKVVVPIFRALQLQKAEGMARPRLTWCPTGEFVFVPVHAAGVYEGAVEKQECCSDYVVSSYTPTLTALRRAQAGPTSTTRSEMTLLAVAEGRAANLPFLANAAAEADQVQRIAQSASVAVIPTGQAGPPSTTIDNLKTSLPAADIVHLACHGVQDQEDPLLSGFCFGDDKLTVHDLVRLSLPRAWLAFMSACETAKGDHAQPDQTVHLAAAMLFCGFRSVIGTMWSMGDEDGPDVAKTVYKALFAQEIVELDAVPRALDAAVRKLRAQGVAPERWATFIHLGA